MIYTVTLNPSVDLIVETDSIVPGEINRMNNDLKLPGGKGINTSRVLRQLGMPSIATGFLGGFTGTFIEEWLEKEDIHTSFISIDDDTRINIKLLHQDETVINGKGPNVSVMEIQELLYFLSRVGEGDTIIMSGSIPPTVGTDIYDRIISICQANKANFVIDAPSQWLLRYVEKKPMLIKPNKNDIQEMFGVKLESIEEIIPYGEKLVEIGAKYAIVSLGEEGALLFTGDEVYKSEKIEGTYVNSQGSRDAMIAGFLATYIRTSDPVESFSMASAAASATAFTKDLARRSQIYKLREEVSVIKIK